MGMVSLVGAGPGDPGLITVKGLRRLQEADVVVYDRLVDRRLLEQAGPGAELVDVGKGRGERRMGQEEINALLVRLGQEGKRVVRLKGGDPFLFGRGGEEALALAEAGVPFQVVPGVTSALAVPAYAGIPVTHRALSSSLAVVTGSEDPSRAASRVDWQSLARADTLVVLMGVEALPAIVAALRDAGKPPETPVALVRWGTEPYQQTVAGTLVGIVEQAFEAALRPPVVMVVGEVVRLREKLRWFDTGPLFGKRVLVTRTRQQASVLSELLAREGAWPVELPAIAIEPLEDLSALDTALKQLSTYQWVAFTSANAVALVFQRLQALERDARAFGEVRVCAIGPGTAAALEARGLRADYTPGEFVSEALAEGLRKRVTAGDRVLLPRAVGGRDVLAKGLQAAGAAVDEVPLYRAITPSDSRDRARSILEEGVDIATFTSSSTVRNLVDLLNGEVAALRGATVACIGPVTAQTVEELLGRRPDVVATEYTVPGLVAALREHFMDSHRPLQP
jgi:uroporphyrinogen III methyltransferase/synthase